MTVSPGLDWVTLDMLRQEIEDAVGLGMCVGKCEDWCGFVILGQLSKFHSSRMHYKDCWQLSSGNHNLCTLN